MEKVIEGDYIPAGESVPSLREIKAEEGINAGLEALALLQEEAKRMYAQSLLSRGLSLSSGQAALQAQTDAMVGLGGLGNPFMRGI